MTQQASYARLQIFYNKREYKSDYEKNPGIVISNNDAE
jgi:hypothetical protein